MNNSDNINSGLVKSTPYSRNNKQNGLKYKRYVPRHDSGIIIEDSVVPNNFENERTPLISGRAAFEDSCDYRSLIGLGKSTFKQTVFNAINTFVGVAILSLPFAFKHAGWFFGFSIFLFYLIQTNYTAKLLKKCLDTEPKCLTYIDLTYLAFGKKGKLIIGGVFLADLFIAEVAIMILAGDSLKALFPHVDLVQLKLIVFFIVTPITWMPIHFLSHVSMCGIVATLSLAAVVLIDGFTKFEPPGSLFKPMDTYLFPQHWMGLPLSFGLINCAFAGHAILPSLYRDMAKPESYNHMVDCNYLIAGIVYLTVAVSGYLMFGSETMKEITLNIMSTPGFSGLLNSIVVWLIVINPLSKFPIIMVPINQTIEIGLFGLLSPRSKIARTIYVIISRTLLSSAIVITSIFLPDFDRAVALLGACFSFLITVIFPLLFHLKMFGRQLSNEEIALDMILLIMSSIMATMGTIWTFFPRDWLEAEN